MFVRIRLFVLLILCIIVLAVISLPFENLLFRFDTPEKLFNYSQNGQIVDVVHGEDSCMVYYEKNQGTYSRVIFRKKDCILQSQNFTSLNRVMIR